MRIKFMSIQLFKVSEYDDYILGSLMVKMKMRNEKKGVVKL